MPAPEPVTYPIGGEVDESRIARWLPGTERVGPPRAVDRTLLDTFDGRLRRRRLALWLEGSRGAYTLRLDGTGSAALCAPLGAADPRRIMASALPDGVLGERLRGIIEERALLPQVRLKVRSLPLKVCNRDGKTVVRLSLDEPVLVRGHDARTALQRRLRVAPVLGYGPDFERVTAALQRRLNAHPPTDGVDIDLLDEAMKAAGRPATGVSSDVQVSLERGNRADRATAAICRRLAEVVEINRPGVLADTDPEFLHDLRVAVRRTRSVLKEMNGVFLPDVAARARADLRWIQEVTGPTRDLDVLLHDWPAMTDPVPPAMAGDLRPLVDLLRGERAEAYQVMRRHLRSRRFVDAWDGWRAVIARPSFEGPAAGQPVGDMAGGRIVSVYRGMVRMGSKIGDTSPPEALHDLRKKGKELRYLLELFGGMWPAGRVKPLVTALKGLQDVLGHFQDDEIQVKELRSLGPAVAAAPGGTDSLIALGFVIDGLTASQKQARLDFAGRFAEFARPTTRRVVDETFRVR